jgi:hypothetical protein
VKGWRYSISFRFSDGGEGMRGSITLTANDPASQKRTGNAHERKKSGTSVQRSAGLQDSCQGSECIFPEYNVKPRGLTHEPLPIEYFISMHSLWLSELDLRGFS